MKNNKKEKQKPNIVVFLVEGESDQIVLETPMAELIFKAFPEYEVRFALQEKRIDRNGEELEQADEDELDDFDEYIEEEYTYGGDITTSSYVTPENIEIKIVNRFIMPMTRKEGIYPKRIAKIIHIVDLDGAFLADSRVVDVGGEQNRNDPYYDDEHGIISTKNIEGICNRNHRKRENLDALIGLTKEMIKVKSKRIPYEVYYFSSNMDHYVNHDANISGGKKNKARQFLRQYGLNTTMFCDFFIGDKDSAGHVGYYESWDLAKENSNSVKRLTNIDFLIQKLMKGEI